MTKGGIVLSEKPAIIENCVYLGHVELHPYGAAHVVQSSATGKLFGLERIGAVNPGMSGQLFPFFGPHGWYYEFLRYTK